MQQTAPLRFATIGAGFWAPYQLAAWRELAGVSCVAICNRTRARAEALAGQFAIPAVYDDPERLLAREPVDFVDVVTEPSTHERLVRLCAERGRAVICQKPMAGDLAACERMVEACRERGVPFHVHENWRHQAPLRTLKSVLETGRLGRVFRARLEMVSGYDVFVNQPFLRGLERFLLTDVGSHVLDTARFLFGEVESLICHTSRVHADVRGEDVATVLLRTAAGANVTCLMGYAGTPLERECFPQTLAFVEGELGSLELGPHYEVRVTTAEGTDVRRVPPPRYAWADPRYEVVHASAVPCNADILRALRGEGRAETTGEDNLRTMRLVYGAYDSAARGEVVRFPGSGASA